MLAPEQSFQTHCCCKISAAQPGQGTTMEMSSAFQTRFTGAAAGVAASGGGGGGPGPSPAACGPDGPCPATPARAGQAVNCWFPLCLRIRNLRKCLSFQQTSQHRMPV